MLTIQIPKSDEELITSVKNTFKNCEAIEVNSLGADTIIQILVPVITAGIPATSAIIVQILKNKKATVKYDRFQISGTSKNITKILGQIMAYEASKKIEGDSSKKDDEAKSKESKDLGVSNES